MSGSSARSLVSIVIPTYNYADHLPKAIDSVLRQEYPDVELIVIDDGSTDHTRTVLEQYGQRFYWETQRNVGQVNTLNKGWRLARGEILSYLNADDTLEPRAVLRSVEALEAHPDVVMTYSDFKLIDPASRVIRHVTTPEYSYRDMVLKLICAPGPGVFWRRRAFDQAGWWDPAIVQGPDYDYWLRLGLVGRFLRIGEPLASLRVHESSQSFATLSVERADEPIQILDGYFRTTRVPPDLVDCRDQAFGMAHLLAARSHIRAGRYVRAFRHVRHAASLDVPNLLTWRAARLLINAIFNRLGHRLVWRMPVASGRLHSRSRKHASRE